MILYYDGLHLLSASQQGYFHKADYQLLKKGHLFELIIRL